MPYSHPWIKQPGQRKMAVDQKEVADISRCYSSVMGHCRSCDMHIESTPYSLRPGIRLPQWLQGTAKHHLRENPVFCGCYLEEAKFPFDVGYEAVESFVFCGVLLSDFFYAEIKFEIDKLRNCGVAGWKRRKPTLHHGATLRVEDLPHNIGVEYIQHRTVPEWPIKMRAGQPIRNLPVRMPVGKRCQIPSTI